MSGEFYLTADTHFGHRLVAQDIRGFDTIEQHDEALVTAWNERVKPGDVVYHLGDFMLPQHQDRAEKLLRTLHGTKNLILGNHERPQAVRAKGWASTQQYKHKRFRSGFHVCMFHYAMRTWEGMHYGYFHAYGHSHGQLEPIWGRSMDVGVDTRLDFSPWHVDEFFALLDCMPVLEEGHHTRELAGVVEREADA